jgi:probable phosphoglycerate mutase
LARPELVAVRHGETAWTITGQHTSRTDIALTDKGRDHALRLGEALAGRTFALVLSSPSRRAVETCALAGYGDAMTTDADLAEWDYGDYEGETTDEIRAHAPRWSLCRDGAPGGESPSDVAARADRVIARCLSADGDTLVFGHGHALRVLAARWVGLGPDAGALFALDPASVSTLGWEREARVVRQWNSLGRTGSVS